MKSLPLYIFLVASLAGFSQNPDLPADFLNKEFHKQRRQHLREDMPPNSVAVFFANAARNRANDVEYAYHQDPDFYYLSGYKEPDAVLLIFKDKQTSSTGTAYDEIIFVQARNAFAEMWTGRRLGDTGVHEQLGFELSFNNKEFKKYNIDFSKFNDVLFHKFQNDVRNDPRDSSDLYDLINQFKAKANFQEKTGLTLSVEPQRNNLNEVKLGSIMDGLRGIKTPEELELIQRAVRISCQGQVEVMKAMKPGMSEREVQGIHEFIFKKYQAEDLGYGSIVGGGHNGCILHYIENYKPSITNKELVLMDLGAEYHGYTADITRTIPASGKFSPEQKQIYDIVLNAQQSSIDAVKPGVTFQQISKIARDIVNKGLKDLGIIQNESEGTRYYPHGLSHHLGLDVHDRGDYGELKENMVITVEPGIYIPDDSKCDKKWLGIAVRIEDDVVVTKDGHELLSGSAPRTTKEIEAMMKLPSVLDNFILPPIEKKN